eukprot:1931663-Prymnesium_polylepis.2
MRRGEKSSEQAPKGCSRQTSSWTRSAWRERLRRRGTPVELSSGGVLANDSVSGSVENRRWFRALALHCWPGRPTQRGTCRRHPVRIECVCVHHALDRRQHWTGALLVDDLPVWDSKLHRRAAGFRTSRLQHLLQHMSAPRGRSSKCRGGRMRWNHARWKDCARGGRFCPEILTGSGLARRFHRLFQDVSIGRVPERWYLPPPPLQDARRLVRDHVILFGGLLLHVMGAQIGDER